MSDPTIDGFQRAKPAYEPVGSPGKPLSVGVVIIIVCAVLVAVALLGVAACCICRWKKKRRTHPPVLPPRGRVPAETTVVVHSSTGEQEQGRVPPTSSEEAEASLSREHTIDVDVCEFCRRAYENAEREVLHCEHVFHRPCIQRWLRVNLACPTCNTTNIVLAGDTPGEASAPRHRYTSSVDLDVQHSKDDIYLHRPSFRV